MFDNKLFEDWLDKEVTNAMQKITLEKTVTFNQTMVLFIKHFNHLDKNRQKFLPH